MEKESSFIWETEIFKTWEAASDEVKFSILIHYMKEYNVDETYDNYILLTLAAHGFLKIEYDRQVDESVLRHMKKENIWLKKEGDRVAKDMFGHSISVVHSVPENHSLYPLVECVKSHFVNNYSHSYKLYASKFEADFKLTYLLSLIGEKKLRENIRRIFLDTYQPKSDTAFTYRLRPDGISRIIPKEKKDESHLSPEIVYSASTNMDRNYGEWESFALKFLDIKQGSVLDFYAGIGTLAMQMNLDNVAYTANMSQQKEHDLMNMLFFTDADFSDLLAKHQIQLFNDGLKGLEMRGLMGASFDYIVANCFNDKLYGENRNSLGELDLLNAIYILLSSKGKALVAWHNRDFRTCRSYMCLIDSIILLSIDISVVLLNKNKEPDDVIRVYDCTNWKIFTAEQLLGSIHKQDTLHLLTQEDIKKMGGYFNIDVFKRKQYKVDVPIGLKLVRLSDVAERVVLHEKALENTKILLYAEEYKPLSPYISAARSRSRNKFDDISSVDIFLIDRKLLLIGSGYTKKTFRPLIFDPRDGEVGVSFYICLVVDEEKVSIDYLVYEMNQEYFLRQLFPHEGDNVYSIKAEDILSCQILVPDVESSVERQKQDIEDLRQKEIAKIAQRYGFDLGKFVQYKASDLLKGMTLRNGKYTILKGIGHGGFGKVYEARNEETGEIVAIKEFFYHSRQVRDPETNNVRTNFADIGYVDNAKEKFRRERDKIKECAHDHIVQVYEEFDENNTCYYVMEYIDGKTLKDYCNLEERKALAIIRQVAEALKSMHEKGYNHSDVKPQNILLDSNGVATLIDFSGAHYYGDEEEGLSITGNSIPMEIKTPGYTPKCAYDTQEFHAGRDIYSLGATLYYMLTGNEPATIDKQVKPDKISPKSWKGICSAMEEDPRIWLRSMDEFLALLPGDDEAKINDAKVSEPTRKWRITPRPVVELKRDEMFVFGSNIKGLHTGSAAKQALKWGAQMGVASGPMGDTYAIPTVKVTGFDAIERYVSQFIKYVEENDHITFYVTAIGCGNAGFSPEQIAPLFRDCIDLPNVYLPESFWRVLRNKGFIK